jgi:uncharacterized membrane protein YphA (DoxX/SURF4 family)
MKQLGIALVVFGIIAMIAGVVGFERQTTAIDVGGFKATATERKTIPAATVAGVASLIGGVALLLGSKRRT